MKYHVLVRLPFEAKTPKEAERLARGALSASGYEGFELDEDSPPALYAIKYETQDEIYLVRASCLEEAEDLWAESRRKSGQPAVSAFTDVRTVPPGIVRTSQLMELFK